MARIEHQKGLSPACFFGEAGFRFLNRLILTDLLVSSLFWGDQNWYHDNNAIKLKNIKFQLIPIIADVTGQ